jgi:hypothetical protein
MSSPGHALSNRAGAVGDGDDRSGRRGAFGGLKAGAEGVVDLAGAVAREAADDLGLGLAFRGTPLGAGAGALAVAQAADGDRVQRGWRRGRRRS